MRKTISYILLFVFAALSVSYSVHAETTLFIKRNTDGTIDNEQQQITTPKPRGVVVVTPEAEDNNKINTGIFVKSGPAPKQGGLVLPPVPAQDYRAALAAIEGGMGAGSCTSEEAQELARLERKMLDISEQLARGEYANEGIVSSPKNSARITDLYIRCGSLLAAIRR